MSAPAEARARQTPVKAMGGEEAEPRPARFLESRSVVWALLTTTALVLAVNSLRPYTHSEARYVEAGLEMVTGGDWVVPHVAFVAYFEKPILAYWAEAGSLLAFGMNPISARLPSILSGVFMVWATCALGRDMRTRAFGIGAAALLLSAAIFDVLGSVITTDALFSACLAAAWYAFWRHARDPMSAWIWLFWMALGLAVMTKGPLGVALVGATVGTYLLLAGRFVDLLAIRPVRGALVILAINAPWSWLVWQRDPRLLEFFYYRENLRALVDGKVHHGGPFWYYVPILVGGFFPFVPLAACAFVAEPWRTFASAIRRARHAEHRAGAADARLYASCMLVPPLLILSLSASKLGTYLMPLLPGAALVFAFWLTHRLPSPPALLRRAILLEVALLGLVAIAAPLALDRVPPEVVDTARREAWTASVAVALLVAPLAGGAYAMLRGRIVRGMAIVALGSITGIAYVAAHAVELDTDRLAGGVARQLVAVRKPGERVLIVDNLVDDYSVVLALRERLAIWGEAGELGMGHFTELRPPPQRIPARIYHLAADGEVALPESPWLLDTERLQAAWKGKDRLWLVCRSEDVARLRAMGLEVQVLAQQYRNAVVTNQPLREPE